jgi:hypothetical protein
VWRPMKAPLEGASSAGSYAKSNRKNPLRTSVRPLAQSGMGGGQFSGAKKMRTGGTGSYAKLLAFNTKNPLGHSGECPLLMEERTLSIPGFRSAFGPIADIRSQFLLSCTPPPPLEDVVGSALAGGATHATARVHHPSLRRGGGLAVRCRAQQTGKLPHRMARFGSVNH